MSFMTIRTLGQDVEVATQDLRLLSVVTIKLDENRDFLSSFGVLSRPQIDRPVVERVRVRRVTDLSNRVTSSLARWTSIPSNQRSINRLKVGVHRFYLEKWVSVK